MSRRHPVRIPPKLPDPPTTTPKPEVPSTTLRPNIREPKEINLKSPWGRTVPFVYGKGQVHPLPVARWIKNYWPTSALCVLYVVAYGPVSSITNFRWGDLTSAEVGAYTVQTYLGGLSQTLTLEQRTALGGTNLPGFALLYVEYYRDENAAEVNPAMVTCDVEGLAIDPRSDPTLATTYVRSNPALHLADFLINKRYGAAIDSTYIDWDSVIAAANWCDATIGTPARPRFEFGFAFEDQQTIEDRIEFIRGHAQLFLSYDVDKYKILIDGPKSATGYVLSDDPADDDNNLIATSLEGLSGSQLPNKVVVQWKDAAYGWREREVELSRDGVDSGEIEEVAETITLHGCQSGDQARRHATYFLNRGLLDLRIKAAADRSAMQVTPGDRIVIDSIQQGLTNQDILVSSVIRAEDSWKLTAEIYDAAIYSDTVVDELDPIIEPLNPNAALDDVSFSLTYSLERLQPPRVEVTWTVPQSAYYGGVEIFYRQSGAANWTNHGVYFNGPVEFAAEPFKTYEVMTKVVNWKSGLRSTGATDSILVGDATPPWVCGYRLSGKSASVDFQTHEWEAAPVRYDAELFGSGWSFANCGNTSGSQINDGNGATLGCDWNVAGVSVITLDCGAGETRAFRDVRVTGAAESLYYYVEYSDNGVDWSDVWGSATVNIAKELVAPDGSSYSPVQSVTGWPSVGAHRYWRLRQDGAGAVSLDFYDVQFYEHSTMTWPWAEVVGVCGVADDPEVTGFAASAAPNAFVITETALGYYNDLGNGGFQSSVNGKIHVVSAVDGSFGPGVQYSLNASALPNLYGVKPDYEQVGAQDLAVVNGTYNDVAISSYVRQLRVPSSVTGNVVLTGFLADGINNDGDEGRVWTITNDSSYLLYIAHESSGSSAANRFSCPEATTFYVPTGQSVDVIYDYTDQRFRIVQPGPVLSLSNGALDPENDWFPFYDNSLGYHRRALVGDVLSGWPDGGGFSLDQTTSDMVLVYDASVGFWKRVLLRDLVVRLTTQADTLSGTDDYLHYYDGSSGMTKKLMLRDLINYQAVDASPDAAADYVLTYDASAGTTKKVLLSSIAGSSGPPGTTTLALTSGNFHNQAVSAAGLVRLTATGTSYLTGMIMDGDNSQFSGRPVTLYNASVYWVFVYCENGSSTASNRFHQDGYGTPSFQGIYPKESITVVYDTANARWQIVNVSGVISREAVTLDPYNDVFQIADNSSGWMTVRSGNLNQNLSTFNDGAGFTIENASDQVLVYDNSAGQWKRVLLRDLILRVYDMSDLDPVNDKFFIYDNSAGVYKKMAARSLITLLSADASPDGANDYVMTYDASAASLKKVLLSNLPSSGGGWTYGTASQSLSGLSGTLTVNYAYSGNAMIIQAYGSGSAGGTPVYSASFTLPASKVAKYSGEWTGLYTDGTYYASKLTVAGGFTSVTIYPLGNGGTFPVYTSNTFTIGLTLVIN